MQFFCIPQWDAARRGFLPRIEISAMMEISPNSFQWAYSIRFSTAYAIFSEMARKFSKVRKTKSAYDWKKNSKRIRSAFGHKRHFSSSEKQSR